MGKKYGIRDFRARQFDKKKEKLILDRQGVRMDDTKWRRQMTVTQTSADPSRKGGKTTSGGGGT